MIQVSPYDVRRMGAPPNYPLDAFAKTMVDSKRKAVDGWKSTEAAVEIDEVPAWRIEWAGLVQIAPARAAVLRGVMLLGMKDDVGFRLEAQDVEARSGQSMPEGERSLRSFALTVKR